MNAVRKFADSEISWIHTAEQSAARRIARQTDMSKMKKRKYYFVLRQPKIIPMSDTREDFQNSLTGWTAAQFKSVVMAVSLGNTVIMTQRMLVMLLNLIFIAELSRIGHTKEHCAM